MSIWLSIDQIIRCNLFFIQNVHLTYIVCYLALNVYEIIGRFLWALRTLDLLMLRRPRHVTIECFPKLLGQSHILRASGILWFLLAHGFDVIQFNSFDFTQCFFVNIQSVTRLIDRNLRKIACRIMIYLISCKIL